MHVNQNAICVYLYNNTPCNASVNVTDVFAVLFMNELKNLTNVVIGKFRNKTVLTTFFLFDRL